MDAGVFLGIAALITALATLYSHRQSAKSSAKTTTIAERAQETEEDRGLVADAIQLAQAVRAEMTAMQADSERKLQQIRDDASRRLAEIQEQLDTERGRGERLQVRVRELERERDELLELLDAMGAPRTAAQARRRQRSEPSTD